MHPAVGLTSFFNVSIADNKVTGFGGGGAVMIGEPHSMTMVSSVLRNNMAGEGGAVWITGKTSLIVSRCTIVDNVASSFAGAISTSGGVTLMIFDSTLANNSAQRISNVLAFCDDFSASLTFHQNLFLERCVRPFVFWPP